ncbi:MAG: glutamate synthase subunit alpha, partial [Magnetococcales bacterium]|nr:glutamate synthase subunit alpha [Magnetococcales bacterium]
MTHTGLPAKQGLYDPRFEHDACGVGFVADIHGRKSHRILEMALEVLVNMTHRGAAGADPLTGDGAGIMIQMPDDFLQQRCAALNIQLPPLGEYGVGVFFLPKDAEFRLACVRTTEVIVREEGQAILGWRDVPIHSVARIGFVAKSAEPVIKQLFIGMRDRPENADDNWFERRLYIIRRRIENAVVDYEDPDLKSFHVASMSSRVLLYKGMFLADQVAAYFQDLNAPDMVSAFAMVHDNHPFSVRFIDRVAPRGT